MGAVDLETTVNTTFKAKVMNTKAYRQLEKTIESLRKKIKNLQTALKGKSTQVRNLKNKINSLNKGFDDSRKKGNKWADSFNMNALSIMFFGMAIQRVFKSIAFVGIQTFTKVSEGVTQAGQTLTILSAEVEYLKFRIGSAIGDALVPMIAIFVNIIRSISDWVKENPKLATTIIAVGLALGTLLMVVGMLHLGISGLIGFFFTAVVPMFAFFATTIGSVILAFGLLAIAFATLYAKSETFRNVVNTIWKIVFGTLRNAAELVLALFETVWTAILIILDSIGAIDFFKMLKDTFVAGWQWAGEIVMDILEKIADTIGWIGDKLNAFRNFMGGVRDKILGDKGGRQFGGVIPEDGLYRLHRGEQVLSSSLGQTTTNNSFGNINVTVNTTGGVDERSIADRIMDEISRRTTQ